MNTLFDCLTEEAQQEVLETKQQMAKGEWVSNVKAQRAHDSDQTLNEVHKKFLENGFC